MEICSNNHEEVAYVGWDCPFCEVMDEHEKETDELQDTINDLNSEIQNLQGDEE